MRFFLIFLIILSFSSFADVTGTWAFSGSGCRDTSLNPDSHRSAAPDSDNPVDEAIFVFRSDGTAEMNAIFQDGDKQRETGTYSLNGNRLTIPQWENVKIRVMGNRIIIQDEEESSCNSGEVFVYILAPVD